jgi:hypothetical protein
MEKGPGGQVARRRLRIIVKNIFPMGGCENLTRMFFAELLEM